MRIRAHTEHPSVYMIVSVTAIAVHCFTPLIFFVTAGNSRHCVLCLARLVFFVPQAGYKLLNAQLTYAPLRAHRSSYMRHPLGSQLLH